MLLKNKISLLILILIFGAVLTPAFADVDRFSSDNLKSKKHFAIMNPFAESIAQKVIKKTLKSETGSNYKVKFDGYTLSSMKKGIFKNLEISGKNLSIEGIEVPYLKIKTISDYNWIDYTQKPPVFKSDMTYWYEIYLSENSINQALKTKEYQKKLEKVNNKAYPLFVIYDVRVKLRHDKVHIIMDYNFPIAPSSKNRSFMISSDFKVEENKIKAYNIGLDNACGRLSAEKVANLINLLDPLSFTLGLMDKKKCNAKIENVKIVDNIIQINGKIFVKGE